MSFWTSLRGLHLTVALMASFNSSKCLIFDKFCIFFLENWLLLFFVKKTFRLCYRRNLNAPIKLINMLTCQPFTTTPSNIFQAYIKIFIADILKYFFFLRIQENFCRLYWNIVVFRLAPKLSLLLSPSIFISGIVTEQRNCREVPFSATHSIAIVRLEPAIIVTINSVPHYSSTLPTIFILLYVLMLMPLFYFLSQMHRQRLV